MLVRLKRRRGLRQLVRQALLVHDPVVLVAEDHHSVVRMQAYATIVHVGLPLGQSASRKLTLTPPLHRGEEAGYMNIIRPRWAERPLA